MVNRAKQFQPFDALKGFKEAIKERQRVVVEKKELCEEDINKLNYKFNQIKKGMIITIMYFDGDYIKVVGMVSNIDINSRTITIVKNKINLDSIIDISGDEIEEID